MTHLHTEIFKRILLVFISWNSFALIAQSNLKCDSVYLKDGSVHTVNIQEIDRKKQPITCVAVIV